MSYCVEFTNVAKKIGEHPVLKNLNAKLPKAQTTAVLGESGSGKTTMLRLMNAMYLPDEGHVHVMGQPVPQVGLPQFRRKIGYAVQGAGLYPHMSIESNISCLARIVKWPAERIEERLTFLLDLTGLTPDMRERYPHELSGGQQHRVGLCRALMLEPQLLLLDEPFSAIDAITRRDIHQSYLDLQRKLQLSAVLVTHDFEEAKRLADFLVVLVDGEIAQLGPIKEVLDDPKADFLRGLMESAS